MYRTGIQNVQVLLLEEEEEFLNNKRLELANMEEEILFESELRGAMNSIELAIDRLYQNINEREHANFRSKLCYFLPTRAHKFYLLYFKICQVNTVQRYVRLDM